jgi:hypothetical protein
MFNVGDIVKVTSDQYFYPIRDTIVKVESILGSKVIVSIVNGGHLVNKGEVFTLMSNTLTLVRDSSLTNKDLVCKKIIEMRDKRKQLGYKY